MVHGEHAPALEECGGIVQRLALAALVARDEADDRREREFPRQPVERLQASRYEARVLDEVARRVAHQRHFGENGEGRALRRSPAGRVQDSGGVAVEVADGRVDLRQRDFHSRGPIPWTESEQKHQRLSPQRIIHR